METLDRIQTLDSIDFQDQKDNFLSVLQYHLQSTMQDQETKSLDAIATKSRQIYSNIESIANSLDPRLERDVKEYSSQLKSNVKTARKKFSQ